MLTLDMASLSDVHNEVNSEVFTVSIHSTNVLLCRSRIRR